MTAVIPPPKKASGVIYATVKSCELPENLPSEIKLALLPRPARVIADIDYKISGISVTRLGPQYLITTTFPDFTFPFLSIAHAAD